MALSREQILGAEDLKIKEIEVPVWNDTVYIKQLTRGQQDEYHKRQFSKLAMKQQGKSQNIESNIIIFGHDAWIFAQGVCDEDGKRMFTDAEVIKLDEKNGEAIGFVASEIVKFSGMESDISELEKIKN
jgi:hypothetical protein